MLDPIIQPYLHAVSPLLAEKHSEPTPLSGPESSLSLPDNPSTSSDKYEKPPAFESAVDPSTSIARLHVLMEGIEVVLFGPSSPAQPSSNRSGNVLPQDHSPTLNAGITNRVRTKGGKSGQRPKIAAPRQSREPHGWVLAAAMRNMAVSLTSYKGGTRVAGRLGNLQVLDLHRCSPLLDLPAVLSDGRDGAAEILGLRVAGGESLVSFRVAMGPTAQYSSQLEEYFRVSPKASDVVTGTMHSPPPIDFATVVSAQMAFISVRVKHKSLLRLGYWFQDFLRLELLSTPQSPEQTNRRRPASQTLPPPGIAQTTARRKTVQSDGASQRPLPMSPKLKKLKKRRQREIDAGTLPGLALPPPPSSPSSSKLSATRLDIQIDNPLLIIDGSPNSSVKQLVVDFGQLVFQSSLQDTNNPAIPWRQHAEARLAAGQVVFSENLGEDVTSALDSGFRAIEDIAINFTHSTPWLLTPSHTTAGAQQTSVVVNSLDACLSPEHVGGLVFIAEDLQTGLSEAAAAFSPPVGATSSTPATSAQRTERTRGQQLSTVNEGGSQDGDEPFDEAEDDPGSEAGEGDEQDRAAGSPKATPPRSRNRAAFASPDSMPSTVLFSPEDASLHPDDGAAPAVTISVVVSSVSLSLLDDLPLPSARQRRVPRRLSSALSAEESDASSSDEDENPTSEIAEPYDDGMHEVGDITVTAPVHPSIAVLAVEGLETLVTADNAAFSKVQGFVHIQSVIFRDTREHRQSLYSHILSPLLPSEHSQHSRRTDVNQAILTREEVKTEEGMNTAETVKPFVTFTFTTVEPQVEPGHIVNHSVGYDVDFTWRGARVLVVPDFCWSIMDFIDKSQRMASKSALGPFKKENSMASKDAEEQRTPVEVTDDMPRRPKVSNGHLHEGGLFLKFKAQLLNQEVWLIEKPDAQRTTSMAVSWSVSADGAIGDTNRIASPQVHVQWVGLRCDTARNRG